MHPSVLPTFSSMRFSVVGFMMRSLIHLNLCLCMVVDMDLFSLFYMLISSYTSIIFWIRFLFSILYFCFFLKNQELVGVWIDIHVFLFDSFGLLSVFMPIPGCFQYCSFGVEFEVRECDAFRSSFIVQNCFGYPVVFFAFL